MCRLKRWTASEIPSLCATQTVSWSAAIVRLCLEFGRAFSSTSFHRFGLCLGSYTNLTDGPSFGEYYIIDRVTSWHSIDFILTTNQLHYISSLDVISLLAGNGLGYEQLGISEHKTVNKPQKLMRGRMFN